MSESMVLVPTDQDLLEQMMENYGLEWVLRALAEACLDASRRLEDGYAATPASIAWLRDRRLLVETANKLEG